MSVSNMFDVEFRAVKLSAGGQGPTYMYVKPVRRATIFAASIHPKDLLATLNADITLNTGETLEILHARPALVTGTEGGQVLS